MATHWAKRRLWWYAKATAMFFAKTIQPPAVKPCVAIIKALLALHTTFCSLETLLIPEEAKLTNSTACVENMMVTKSFGRVHTTSTAKVSAWPHFSPFLPSLRTHPSTPSRLHSLAISSHTPEKRRRHWISMIGHDRRYLGFVRTTQINSPAKDTIAANTQRTKAAPGLPTPWSTKAGTEKMPLPAKRFHNELQRPFQRLTTYL